MLMWLSRSCVIMLQMLQYLLVSKINFYQDEMRELKNFYTVVQCTFQKKIMTFKIYQTNSFVKSKYYGRVGQNQLVNLVIRPVEHVDPVKPVDQVEAVETLKPLDQSY